MSEYTYRYNKINHSTKLVVINHGVSEGVDSEFIQKIVNKATNENLSTLTIQMPYFDRGETKASQGLLEEIKCVKDILQSIDLEDYKYIHFVGKSLGGLVLNHFLNENIESFDQSIEITYLGFLVEHCTINAKLDIKTNIIQGERDKYGTKTQLDNVLSTLNSSQIKVTYIPNADHSYKNESKESVYQDIAIESINF
jgi:predicted alpha/beta-hydrolase family hydrolase